MQTEESAKNWLIKKIADECGHQPDTLNCDEPIENFDLDSLSSISISMDIETEFKINEINPSVFTEFNTVNKLAAWIQNQM
jgi:acyl carrier protein